MDFCGATFDSRQVKPGMLFVALKGEKSDGHDYIPMALEKGAAGMRSWTAWRGNTAAR